eukprot:jgi/Mesvir1/5681/Mv25219-RA.1
MVSWEAVVSIILVFGSLVILAMELAPPDIVLLAVTLLMVFLEMITLKEAAGGFSQTGMLTVAVLFVVARGLTNSGALEYVSNFYKLTYKYVSGHGVRPLIYHTIPILSCVSAFINNTPIVAMMIPVMTDYARAVRVAPSKLLIPLSYGVMFGGTVTLIGTSTNLVALDLSEKKMPDLKFSLFTQTPVGLPLMLSGILFLAIFGPWLLPNRMGVNESVQNPREYMMEMIVAKDAPFSGKTIEAAGLRTLDGLFLPGFYFVVYVGTAIFSAVVTNNAAVSMMYPIAYEAAMREGHDMKQMLFLLMTGASASYCTPTSYQCNLMVWAPGGYTYRDFLKFGGLCQVWMAFTTVMFVLLDKYWYAFSAGLFVINLGLFLFSLRGKKVQPPSPGAHVPAIHTLSDLSTVQVEEPPSAV